MADGHRFIDDPSDYLPRDLSLAVDIIRDHIDKSQEDYMSQITDKIDAQIAEIRAIKEAFVADEAADQASIDALKQRAEQAEQERDAAVAVVSGKDAQIAELTQDDVDAAAKIDELAAVIADLKSQTPATEQPVETPVEQPVDVPVDEPVQDQPIDPTQPIPQEQQTPAF